MSVRRVLFWCHLVCGVVGGIVILIMSLTGVLLTYERQMLEWVEVEAHRRTPPDGASAMTLEALVNGVRVARPDAAPTAITLRADPALPASVALGPQSVQVDVYSGAIVGEGAVGLRGFFRAVTDWHRWLAMSGESRAVGRAITGACNLAFLFIVLSGLVLWWPRKATWNHWKAVLLFNTAATGKARDFNWHNVIGVWSAIPLAVVVFGGVVISYPWASNLVYRVVGDEPPPAQRPATAARRRDENRELSIRGLDRLWDVARDAAPVWRTATVRLPTSPEQPVTFVFDGGTGGQPQKRVTLEVSRASGTVARTEAFADLSAGRRARSWLRFAHTGEIYGIAGQTVAGLVSLGGVFLVWTGIALALRRFVSWRARWRAAARVARPAA